MSTRMTDDMEALPLSDVQLDEIEKRANAAAEWGGWAIWEDLRDGGFVHVGNLDGVIPDGQIATEEDAESNPIAQCFTREIAEHIASMDPDSTLALLAEVRRLRTWKSEAMQVLSEWEQTWEEAGSPGKLGQSKAVALREEIAALRSQLAEVRETLGRVNLDTEESSRVLMYLHSDLLAILDGEETDRG